MLKNLKCLKITYLPTSLQKSTAEPDRAKIAWESEDENKLLHSCGKEVIIEEVKVGRLGN